MSNYANALAADKLRSAVASLTEHDIPISKAVAAALAELDRIASLKPAEVGPADLTALYSDPAAKPAALILCAAEVSTWGSRRESWSAALNGAGADGLSTIAAEVDEIIEHLRPVAESHIDTLIWFATEGDPDVTELVRARRVDDAQRAATAPLAFADWQALCKMRSDLSGNRVNYWTKGGTWSNPEHVAIELAFKKQLVGLAYITGGVRAGGILYWPTPDEAASVAARVLDSEDKAQTEAHAANRLIHHSAL